MVPISTCIVTCNEEKKIGRCLESVKWTDEIIVVDSGSIDQTISICKKYTDKIIHQDWLGYVNQKNFALKFTTNDWVLSIDSDEELSDELIQEIQHYMQHDQNSIDGFTFPRKTWYMNRWINHSGWYPDYKLRLFRKSKAHWVGNNIHEKIQLEGKKIFLQKNLYHYCYSNLDEHLYTMKNYAEIWASNHSSDKLPSRLKIILRMCIKFLEVYFWKRGFMDGYSGFVIAVLATFQIFWRYVKLRERKQNQIISYYVK